MNWYLDPESKSGLSSKRLKRPVGCIGNHGYWQVSCRKLGVLLAHRVIWEELHGPIPEGMQIDHINRIRTDNSISNLRLVLPHENAENTSAHVDGKVPEKNISVNQGGYAIEVMRQGKRMRTTARTLDEAIAKREDILNGF